MQFSKKLIILNGEYNSKGTLNIERNAYGVFATINLHNLNDLKVGEYCVGIKNSSFTHSRELGALGRILVRFQISMESLDDIHAVVYDTVNNKPLMYGTNGKTKLWEGNMMDGFKKQADNMALVEKASGVEYSTRDKHIRDYFFDIKKVGGVEPPVIADSKKEESKKIEPVEKSGSIFGVLGESYDDTALAQVNYYDKNSLYSSRNDAEIKQKEETQELDFLIKESLSSLPLLKTITSEAVDKQECEIDPQEMEIDKECIVDNIASTMDTQEIEIDKECIVDNIASTMDTQEIEIDKECIVDTTDMQEVVQPKIITPNFGGVKTLRKNTEKEQESVSDETAFTVSPPHTFTPDSASSRVIPKTVFYDQIKSQIDHLFNTCENHTELEKLMPETKWAKVMYDDAGRYYVVGLVGAEPEYICYGVPSTYTLSPPPELGQDCRWLPLDEDLPEEKGFWLMFQDACSGEVIN